jgi:hypothetical protein
MNPKCRRTCSSRWHRTGLSYMRQKAAAPIAQQNSSMRFPSQPLSSNSGGYVGWRAAGLSTIHQFWAGTLKQLCVRPPFIVTRLPRVRAEHSEANLPQPHPNR